MASLPIRAKPVPGQGGLDAVAVNLLNRSLLNEGAHVVGDEGDPGSLLELSCKLSNRARLIALREGSEDRDLHRMDDRGDEPPEIQVLAPTHRLPAGRSARDGPQLGGVPLEGVCVMD